jgi:hypothetical protein
MALRVAARGSSDGIGAARRGDGSVVDGCDRRPAKAWVPISGASTVASIVSNTHGRARGTRDAAA